MAPKAGDKPKAPARMVTKDIGGDKNGGKRTVRAKRLVRLPALLFQIKH